MQQTILVVEDDQSILTGLIDLLSADGYRVVSARDGIAAITLYQREHPDLLLLDIMVPRKNGYDVCREIRKKDSRTPILMLTAKGQEIDKVVGLELGADDYIVKPFGVHELLARIKAAFRRVAANRGSNENSSPIRFGDIEINPKTLSGKKEDHNFEISPREIHILQELLAHDGEIVSRVILLENVWGITYEGTTRTLDQYIVKLRQKIESDPTNPRYIVTVHGVGYRFFDTEIGNWIFGATTLRRAAACRYTCQ